MLGPPMRLGVVWEPVTNSYYRAIEPMGPRLETGLEIRVPFFVEEGEKVKVYTETREFAGRA